MAASTAPKPFDLVVYGASGFTGQYVVEEVARVQEQEKGKGLPLTWAIAGRNKTKLLKVIEEAKKHTGLPLTDVGLLEADVSNPSSVEAMAKQGKVVLNCVGPYSKWGEVVVKASVENGASHVDLSGEPIFQEGMQLRHDAGAREAGVHVVSAVGYDSIPAEMGVRELHRAFPGGAASVDMYMGFTNNNPDGKRSPTNTGTLESAMMVAATRKEYAAQKKILFPTSIPRPMYPSKLGALNYSSIMGRYAVPFESDVPVVSRTMRHRFTEQSLPPIGYRQLLPVQTKMQYFMAMFAFLYFFMMGSFSFTRNLVIKYPSFFTGGFFARGGPDRRERLKNMGMRTTFVAKGWTEKLSEASDQHSTPPDATKMLTIEGPDAGYGATSIMMVASAMTILREADKIPRCGVLTPGFAFQDTSLVDRIKARGMTFTFKDV